MQTNVCEVVILKPTKAFLSFLATQLPEVELPSLKSMHLDSTAYVLPRQEDDEATLNEIERHFVVMFRHEIARYLGEEVCKQVNASFLDFLCCFKFELHTQLILMENSFKESEKLLRIKPRSVLLKWMRETVDQDSEIMAVLDKMNLTHITENATVVVKNFKNVEEANFLLEKHYKLIFDVEMQRMRDISEEWPTVDTYEDFSRYFSVNIHNQVVHLH